MEILVEKREEFLTAESPKVRKIRAKPKTRLAFPTKDQNAEIVSEGFNDHFYGY